MFNTFRGGIYPPQRKTLTENLSIENLSVPQLCHIPMQQHIGSPADPKVKIGDIINEGQLIGQAFGDISANIHAAVPGKVINITESLTGSGSQTMVVIEAEGAFPATGSSAALNDWKSIEGPDLLEMVRESGIVGLGGIPFPTGVKLSPASGVKIDTLIVNGAESEPYLTADDMLMRTYPAEIIEGIRITLKIIGIKKAVIGIEDNKKKAIRSMKDAIKKTAAEENITVKKLKTKYPQGAEKQLIRSILKKAIPKSGVPADSGVTVLNVGTVYAIRDAVVFNKPLIERFITVSGEMINRPGNYKVRIGTKISDIVEECGGLKGQPAKIILGGPMQGISVNTMDLPVLKSTSAVLFLSEKEIQTEYFNSCIRCGRCVSVCPAGLIPSAIARAAEKGRFDLAVKMRVDECIKCSCCSYICPAKRPLSHFVRITLETLSQ